MYPDYERNNNPMRITDEDGIVVGHGGDPFWRHRTQ